VVSLTRCTSWHCDPRSIIIRLGRLYAAYQVAGLIIIVVQLALLSCRKARDETNRPSERTASRVQHKNAINRSSGHVNATCGLSILWIYIQPVWLIFVTCSIGLHCTPHCTPTLYPHDNIEHRPMCVCCSLLNWTLIILYDRRGQHLLFSLIVSWIPSNELWDISENDGVCKIEHKIVHAARLLRCNTIQIFRWHL